MDIIIHKLSSQTCKPDTDGVPQSKTLMGISIESQGATNGWLTKLGAVLKITSDLSGVESIIPLTINQFSKYACDVLSAQADDRALVGERI